MKHGLVACVLATSACDLHTTTTDIRVRDPCQVTIRRADGTIALPPGTAAMDVELAAGRIDTAPNASATYAVRFERAGGAIALAWKTSLPLANGDHHVIVPANAELVLPRANGIATSRDVMEIASCTRVVPRTDEYGVRSYDVEPHECLDGTWSKDDVPYVLETPWSNVEIVERTRHYRGAAWLGVALSTASFGTFGALVVAAHPKDFAGGAATQGILAVSLFGVAALFDLAMLPTLVAEDTDVPIHP